VVGGYYTGTDVVKEVDSVIGLEQEIEGHLMMVAVIW